MSAHPTQEDDVKQARALVKRLETPRVSHHQISHDHEPYETTAVTHPVESIRAEAAATIARLLAHIDAPRGTDAQILKEREITAATIQGAMAMGYQGGEYPPDDAAWLRPFYDIGKADREKDAHIDAQAVRLDAAERDAGRWRHAIADGGNQSMNFMDIYDDWDGDGDFVAAFDAAIASEAKT